MNTTSLNTRRPLRARLICSSPGPMDSNARLLNAELCKVADEVTVRLECAVRDTIAAAVTRYQHSLKDPRTPVGMPTPEGLKPRSAMQRFPTRTWIALTRAPLKTLATPGITSGRKPCGASAAAKNDLTINTVRPYMAVTRTLPRHEEVVSPIRLLDPASFTGHGGIHELV